MESPQKPGAGSILAALAGLAAAILYTQFIAADFASVAGGGESRMANAMATLAALAALWGLLVVHVTIDAATARAPPWQKGAALLLFLIAAAATLFATDYPGDRWCVLSIVALPPLAGSYWLLGWISLARSRPAAIGARTIILLLIASLSFYPTSRFLG